MKTRKTDIVTIRVTEEEKKLLKEKARRKRKTLSAYIISETNFTHTEWTNRNTIKIYIQLGKIFNGALHQTRCEIPVSFLKCMPLYKWRYCQELLLKNKGYCDLDFNQFIKELNKHLICADRLIKLDCLDKLERKSLISLFKRQLKKDKFLNNSIRAKEFIQAVEQLKTNK